MSAWNSILLPADSGGVSVLVLLVGGYAALERGSDLIEPRDLVKAIYIVDLEHVAPYWFEHSLKPWEVHK